ncbi:MAG: hypothetical protein HUU55_05595 [Myxococcales bacterium]|nr:hypothetical protein [Myxococcales bacterium]
MDRRSIGLATGWLRVTTTEMNMLLLKPSLPLFCLLCVWMTFCCLSGLDKIAHAQSVSPKESLPDWLKLDAEYRVRSLIVDPYELSGTDVEHTVWTEQRMRLDLGLRYPSYGGVYIQMDILDGVLFGDNGYFGAVPEPTSGVAVASQQPNNAGWRLGLRSGGDPLNPDHYIPVLKEIDPIHINLLYGEVVLPFGLLRVGRLPFVYGATLSGHEGNRINRWGVSHYSHTADRILFGTKLDEAIRLAVDSAHTLDTSLDQGVFLALAYDWRTLDDIARTVDDQHQISAGLQWRERTADWFGWEWQDWIASAFLTYRFSKEFDTQVYGLPLKLAGKVGPVTFDIQSALQFGDTKEIAEGFAILSNRKPSLQELFAYAVHAFVEVSVGPVDIAMQFDMASGDEDPRATTPLTVFSYARDFNVGLLLFEHILAFESARSAAVGIENLAQLDAPSFPLTEVATDGRFTNAIAIFPQITAHILKNPYHHVMARVGTLLAWPEAGSVDPVMTTLNEDGQEVSDDAVNFFGGKPGSFYGTEVDVHLSWELRSFFTWTMEGAILFPGDALEDEHGDAVPAFFFENRFEFIF